MYVKITKRDVVIDEVGDEMTIDEDVHKEVYIGKVPIMIRSSFCSLNNIEDSERWEMKE